MKIVLLGQGFAKERGIKGLILSNVTPAKLVPCLTREQGSSGKSVVVLPAYLLRKEAGVRFPLSRE